MCAINRTRNVDNPRYLTFILIPSELGDINSGSWASWDFLDHFRSKMFNFFWKSKISTKNVRKMMIFIMKIFEEKLIFSMIFWHFHFFKKSFFENVFRPKNNFQIFFRPPMSIGNFAENRFIIVRKSSEQPKCSKNQDSDIFVKFWPTVSVLGTLMGVPTVVQNQKNSCEKASALWKSPSLFSKDLKQGRLCHVLVVHLGNLRIFRSNVNDFS